MGLLVRLRVIPYAHLSAHCHTVQTQKCVTIRHIDANRVVADWQATKKRPAMGVAGLLSFVGQRASLPWQAGLPELADY